MLRRMAALWRTSIADFLKALALWALVAFSVGWFYRFTYHGGFSIPLPFPEAVATVLLHYFSLGTSNPQYELIHWFVGFPVAALLWITLLAATSPAFGGRPLDLSLTTLRFAMAAIPLALPGPFLALMAAGTGDRFGFRQMMDVAMLRTAPPSYPWVTALYIVVAAISLVIQLRVYSKAVGTTGIRGFQHLVFAFVLLCMTSAGAGALAGYVMNAVGLY